MPKQTLKDLDVKQKTVLVRVDYNVPLEAGKVRDDYRIKASLPTLQYLLEQEAKVVIISHLGRPDPEPQPELSLAPVAKVLSGLLRRPVKFVPAAVGAQAQAAVAKLAPGEVVLLENLRFYPGEEQNSTKFAKQLAALGDVFVQDAFGVIHRKHASTVALAKQLPAAAGLLVDREISELTAALETPRRPLVAIVGGAKVSSKLDLINVLVEKADKVVIGGAMANNFFVDKAYKLPVGKSQLEPGMARAVRSIIKRAGDKLLLPVADVTVAKQAGEDAKARVVAAEEVAGDDIILDFGPKSTRAVLEQVRKAGTVIWNGPVGMAELTPFVKGTYYIAYILAQSRARSIVGGGDTVAFLREAALAEHYDHVSTGGGAMLDFIAGKQLPGLAVLPDKQP